MGLLFTLTGIAVGQTIQAFPVVTAITASIIENIDPALKLTLISLGAGKKDIILTCLWEVRFGILAAAVTAYGRVLTEVGISMIVGGNIKYHTRTMTMTTAIALETNKGLSGPNSSGKTTFLKLLAFAMAPKPRRDPFQRPQGIPHVRQGAIQSRLDDPNPLSAQTFGPG